MDERIVELEPGPDGVYREKRVIRRETPIRQRAAKVAPTKNDAPQDPVQDIVRVLNGIANASNAIAKLLR